MSVEAITWALNEAPDVPPQLVATLIGLANHASPDGRGSYPSQATLAHYTRKSTRSVRNDLAALAEKGIIRRGDQRLVDHLPPDRRPIVWDLVMAPADPGNGRKRATGRKPASARNSTSGRKRGTRPGGSVLPVAGGSVLPPNRPVEPTTEPATRGARASASTDAPLTAPARRPDGLTEIPGDFRPTDSMRRWATATYGAAVNLEFETAQFVSHYRSTGARRKSWPDAWQKWIRESAERRPRPAAVIPIDRRQQATDSLFDRAMQRAIAREEQQ